MIDYPFTASSTAPTIEIELGTISTASACIWCDRYQCICSFTIIRNERILDFKLPKCEHDSVIQMRRIALFAEPRRYPIPRREVAMLALRTPPRALPRSRLRRWRSLKDRRRAWYSVHAR